MGSILVPFSWLKLLSICFRLQRKNSIAKSIILVSYYMKATFPSAVRFCKICSDLRLPTYKQTLLHSLNLTQLVDMGTGWFCTLCSWLMSWWPSAFGWTTGRIDLMRKYFEIEYTKLWYGQQNRRVRSDPPYLRPDRPWQCSVARQEPFHCRTSLCCWRPATPIKKQAKLWLKHMLWECGTGDVLLRMLGWSCWKCCKIFHFAPKQLSIK